jgi:hypothetical protein
MERKEKNDSLKHYEVTPNKNKDNDKASPFRWNKNICQIHSLDREFQVISVQVIIVHHLIGRLLNPILLQQDHH